MNRSIAAALLALLPASVPAQKPVPRLYLAPELTIAARQLNTAGNGGANSKGMIYVGPDGRILYTMSYYGDVRFFDSLGKTMPVKVTLADREGEIGWIEHAGWLGSMFWISDPRFKQVVLLDGGGKIVKTMSYPTWVYPHWADRRKYPLFASMTVFGVYADSSLLVRPERPRTLLDTPGFDKTASHLVRIDKDGAVKRLIATFDDDDGNLWLRGAGRSEHVMQAPVVSRSFWKVSGDGKRIVFVKPGTTAADSGTFRVTSLNENGDTVFSRRYPMPVVRVNKKSVDSALATVKAFGDNTAEDIRAKLAQKIPEFRSFVAGLVAGRDQSTWVMLRSMNDTSKTQSALILDERGEPLATVDVSEFVQPLVVDRTHLWGTDRLKLSVVRMRLQATAPPPDTTTVPVSERL
ncbi:MAG: hypothetical protein JWM95_2202 [Gemmatimonadetes bacterium]|nr:hypothetical protein [Gemmatimonadota bacterium]